MAGGAVRGGPVLMLLLAAVALVLPFAAAQPWRRCYSRSGNYSSGSTYEDNLFQLISVLQDNATSSPSLFASGSVGTGAGAVYGVLLCRGDLSSSDCYDCATFAGNDVQRACNRTRDVVLCYNQCYVRVSNTDFLASPNNTGVVHLISGSSIGGGANVTAAYDAAVTALLNATAKAVEAASPARMFATGHLVGLDPTFPNIWSMAQCAADLSPAQCRRCLDGLVTGWFGIFEPNGTGARVAGARCNMRSEMQNTQFFTGSPMVKLQLNGLAASPAPSMVVSPGTAPAPSMVALPGAVRGKRISVGKLLGIILPVVFFAAVVFITLCIWNVRKKRIYRRAKLPHRTHTAEDLESIKSILLSLSSLQVATDNFNESNKVGEGGFGAVYKGHLSGQEVAVKRLSKDSSQGLEELRNELVLVAKLHHKNLVRLEGFCLEAGERLLVYEYMPNKSLDTILFDPDKKGQLDWRKRFNIIEGVSRGLQYLHEDSQKKIVHRDMKANNVLLDTDMNPKIGDFGLARLFGQDQTRDITNRIVGTIGYMSPEYVMRGQYSTKSDVFNFGILVIEIITGQRNNGQHFNKQNEDIITIVWRHWSEGTIADIIDDSLGRNYSETEVLKCINIGLLCLQQNPVDRPTMSEIMLMLNSDASLPPAARPTFFWDGSSGYSCSTVPHPSSR